MISRVAVGGVMDVVVAVVVIVCLWPSRAAGQQFVASDFVISDSTSESFAVQLDGISGVAFSWSLYGFGELPTAELLAEFENSYRALRREVNVRRDNQLSSLTGAPYDSAFAAFKSEPDGLLAFAPAADSADSVRQYFRDTTESTDHLYVHVLDRDRLGRAAEADWMQSHVFLEGGGPGTHYLRYNILDRRIDQVTVNWFD